MENNNELVVYSVNEVMEILHYKRNTILRYIKSKKLKAVMIGNQYRVRKCDLEAFLESRVNR